MATFDIAIIVAIALLSRKIAGIGVDQRLLGRMFGYRTMADY
jgi:hypothetical protein